MTENKQIRIVFMGTPEFAVPSLDILIKNGLNVVGVITTPDKPAGRGQKLSQSAIKKYAIEHNIPVYQPEKMKDPEFIRILHEELKPDLNIVVAFRMLPEIIWNFPKYGTFNLHASLLPQYRGAAPINWAVINGEQETGVSTFFIDKEIDTGNVIFQERITIANNETAGSVHDRMMEIGSKLVLKTVNAIAENTIQPISQTEIHGNTTLKAAPKLNKENTRINWNNTAESIKNLIHGLSPYPGAWSELVNEETQESISFKIFSAEAELADFTPACKSIVTDNKKHLKIACGGGLLSVKDIQLAGKKAMKTDDLLRGFQLNEKWKVK